MSSRRWLVSLGCLLVVTMLAVATTGCGGGAADDTTTGGLTGPADAVSVLEGPQGPPSGEQPYYGGTLVILHQFGPGNIGAWWEATGFADYQVARFCLENLVGIDEDGNPVPQLAESWDNNEDFTEITFHLRKTAEGPIKFHDGTDFNAEAVRWNLQMQVDGTKTDVKGVTGMEVLDDYTLRLTLDAPDPLFVQRLVPSGCGKMISPASYEEYGNKVKRNPVGTGPFKLKSLTLGKEVVFERFDDYWQEGLPYLDGVKIVVIPDYQSRKTAFLNGEGHIMYGMNYVDAAELEATGATVQSRIMALISIAAAKDTENPDSPANDLRVRQAISYAIDVPTIVNAVYEGYVEPTNQIAIPGDRAWQMAAWNDDIVGYPYDPAKARELLAEVGITPDNPWEVELTYLSGEDYDQVFTVIKDYLEDVGIVVSLRPVEFGAWVSFNANGWKGLGAMSLSLNPESEYSSMLKTYFNKDAYQFGKFIYFPDEYNDLYEQTLQEIDMDQRHEMYRELNRMAIDDYSLVTPLYALLGNIAVAPELKDNVWCVYSSGEYPVERMWLQPE